MNKIYILHGWSVDRSNEDKWTDFRAELKKLGIDSIFLGLPGLTTALNEEWNLDDYSNWLEKELKGKKDITLLGHSFGGQLAVRYNKTHKDQIKNLILIDSAGIIDRSIKIKIKRKVFGIAAKIGKKVLKREIFRKVLYKLAREKDYYAAPEFQRRTMANVIKEEIIDDMFEIEAPTLIIWGRNDPVTPLKRAYVFDSNISNSQLKIIDDARHAPHFTFPQKVAVKVVEFLS